MEKSYSQVTSTVSIGLAEAESGARTMILAALGCNAAWGIVDGVMYVLASLFDRNRYFVAMAPNS